jgi:hypothetical protein
MLGYMINTFSFEADSGLSSGLVSSYEDAYLDESRFLFDFHVCSHFYFSGMFGAFVEFGYPYWASVGLALKF